MQSQNAEFAAQYREGCVEFYDQLYSSADPNLINRLCDLSAGGRLLELGIGTGRIALPLAARGDVSGIEGSPSMFARLRAKPYGSRLQVVQGNFADGEIEGTFSLIFAVVETLKGPRKYRVRLCYANAQQIDEMAGKAGLRLRERWSNWQRKPYTPSNQMHI